MATAQTLVLKRVVRVVDMGMADVEAEDSAEAFAVEATKQFGVPADKQYVVAGDPVLLLDDAFPAPMDAPSKLVQLIKSSSPAMNSTVCVCSFPFELCFSLVSRRSPLLPLLIAVGRF